MPLLNDVKDICKRLAPHGWGELFKQHGLDILASNLHAELARELTVNRGLDGFSDFSLAGVRGIEPTKPALSLLYHGFASPAVLHDGQGVELNEFPTPDELDTLLNYVFGVTPPSLADLHNIAGADAKLALVTFASEYRTRANTVHGRHADLCYSRTGIGRVGTAGMLYSPFKRRYISASENDAAAIHVIPVRYSAYIAVLQKGNQEKSIPMNFQHTDTTCDFWLPLHKIFEGNECLLGISVDLHFESSHINEKIRFIATEFSNTGWGEQDICHSPFVRSEGLCDVTPLTKLGSVEISPIAHPRLVEQAFYQGKPLTIVAPKNNAGGMLHLRHQLLDNGEFFDLNTSPTLSEQLQAGGHRALQYQDYTADGWVRAVSASLDPYFGSHAAYSVIGPPDFFPLTSQAALNEWVAGHPAGLPQSADNLPRYIWQARLTPLSDIRYPANLTLSGAPFAAHDLSAFSIVSQEWSVKFYAPEITTLAVPSVLPDHAAGTFGPGWEVGIDRILDESEKNITFVCGYRLGTPFTEDVRICAALGSFWPAVSPDSTRTFEPRGFQTHIPTVDSEIGIGKVTSWDGVTGPKVVERGPIRFAEYASYLYTDYTSNALKNTLSVSHTADVSTEQYQQRILALRAIYRALGCAEVTLEDEKRQAEWAILSFDAVQRPHAVLSDAEKESSFALRGEIYYCHLYRHGTVSTAIDNLTKRHVEMLEEILFFTGTNGVLSKAYLGHWKVADDA